MPDETTDHDPILRAEIAIEIMNQARGFLSGRIHDVEDRDPAAAEALRLRRRELLAIQHAIRVEDPQSIEAVIETWGPRVKDEARFWREL